MIDFYLGNTRWIIRQIKKLTPRPARITEIGAGEGILCRRNQVGTPLRQRYRLGPDFPS
jgi:SAM-dependent MidA family methyltransferase